MIRIALISIFLLLTSNLIAQRGKQQLQLELSSNLPLVSNQNKFVYATNSPYSSYAYPVKSSSNISEKLGVSLRATYGMPVIADISAFAGINIDYIAYTLKLATYPMYPPYSNLGSSVLLIDEPVYKTNIAYIGIPLIAKYYLLDDKLSLQAGLVTNFLLASNQKVTKSEWVDGNINIVTSYTKKGLYKIVSLVEVGAGYNIFSEFGVTLRYQRAFTPIYERNYLSADPMYYNIFSLGVIYNLF